MTPFSTIKQITRIGTAFYAILILLAILLYLERTVFVDISFHLFYLLKDGDFAVQNNRFVAIFTQMFPLAGAKLGLGLKAIMIIYSLAFVLLYFGIFWVIVRYLKNWQMALAMVLLNCLMVTHTFYWIQSELPQGLAFLMLYFGILWNSAHSASQEKNMVWHRSFLAFLLFVLTFSHPLILIPFTFISLYFIVHNKEQYRVYLSSLVAFWGFYGIKFKFFKTNYDAVAIDGIKNIKAFFPNYFNLKSNSDFVQYVINDYYLLIIGLIMAIGFYFYKKHILKLVLVGIFFIGYLLLVNVSYPQGTTQFYIENLYLPLSVFVIFPIVFDIAPLLTNKQLLVAVSLIVLIRIADILNAWPIYAARLEYLENLIAITASEPHKKMIIQETPEHKASLMMTWATPYEIWLLSTIKHQNTRSIMITENPDEVAWTLPEKQKFVTKWGAFNYSELSPRFFNFSDTSTYIIRVC